MSHRKSKEVFIEEAQKIHGEKYDYSLVKYKSNKHYVKIICYIHGIYEQQPNTHLNKKKIHGCPHCGREHSTLNRRNTKKTIIKRAKLIFPEYDYSSVTQMKNNKEKMTIICSVHGVFKKSFNALSRGSGCPECGREKTRKALSLTQKEFERRVKIIHRNKYDYSLLNYKNKTTRIKIICPVHGVFEQIAGNHLNGEGCKKCAVEVEGKRKRKEAGKILIRDFKKTHGNKYDYSEVIYISSNKKVKIICKKHGSFWQNPTLHKRGTGCPVCRQSRGERAIAKYLEEKRIKYERNKSFKDCRDKLPLSFDFYIPEKNICIEYDGELHYKKYINSFKGTYKLHITQRHDKIKTEYCIKRGVKLIRIPYWKKNNIVDILRKMIEVVLIK